jgi:hypothetical protein
VLVGGARIDGAGYFYEPTVISDVPDDARLLDEEIFGPVAPVRSFASDDERSRRERHEYGLVAYVYTQDINRAFKVIERLETGMIGLNQGMVSNAGAPFGGVKAVGLRPRGRARGDPGVPGDEVRRHERPVVPRFVDLSAPITASPPELPPLLRTDIDSPTTSRAARTSRRCSACRPSSCATARAGRSETFLRFGHPQLHARRRALALQLDDRRASARRRSTSCRSSGSTRPASCSTSTDRADGEAIDAADVEAELGASATRSPRWTSSSCAPAATPSTASPTT